MAHRTLINGTAYEICGGKTLVGGTAYEIGKGKTLIGGTAYEIGFTPTLGELAVGSSVFMNVKGVRTEFLVVHQGLPGSMYDSSCNGTWLLMKDIYTLYGWSDPYNESTNGNDYECATIGVYMNGAYLLGSFDSNIQAAIKQVKIPYHKGMGDSGSVVSGSNGLSTKIFLLSGYEVGWTISTSATKAYLPVDGACLSYFRGTSETDAKRIAYYNESATTWWLRSPNTGNFLSVWYVTADGNGDRSNYTNSMGVRPAFILPNETLVDENFNVIA